MYQIQLNDQLYHDALRQATANGFESVQDYVVSFIKNDSQEEENFDHLFTPERLAKIDAAIAQVDAGQTISSEELREHFRRKFNS